MPLWGTEWGSMATRACPPGLALGLPMHECVRRGARKIGTLHPVAPLRASPHTQRHAGAHLGGRVDVRAVPSSRKGDGLCDGGCVAKAAGIAGGGTGGPGLCPALAARGAER